MVSKTKLIIIQKYPYYKKKTLKVQFTKGKDTDLHTNKSEKIFHRNLKKNNYSRNANENKNVNLFSFYTIPEKGK